MKNIILIIALTTIINVNSVGQTYPKTEFRGTWVSSVYNLDWPKTRGTNLAAQTVQKDSLKRLLDTLKTAGINSLLFQVRPNCDALYNSAYEPWSYWLTGAEGTAPNPLWDPLTFAIEEAHKRGMELHAWLNPYRVKEGANTALHSSHVINQQPTWILNIWDNTDTTNVNKIKRILNPGLEAVRNYLVNIVMDIVNNYDIDGIHFDDYFYPYAPNEITNQDAQTFADYPRGFTNIGDWRRDNINLLIAAVNNAINGSSKPYIQFGVSPFGIWKSGTPIGITGTSAYSSIYCDAIKWIQDRSVDYLTPQLYWKIGGSQDYDRLMKWWADSVYANQRLFFPGQQFRDTYDNSELPLQTQLNRANSKVSGNSLFRASQFITNNLSFKDSLKNNYNKYKSVVPPLTWKNNIAPNPPSGLTASAVTNGVQLQWNAPSAASDGNLARYYVVYRGTASNVSITNPANIIAILFNNETSYLDANISQVNYYYVVTSLDPYRNESVKSNEASIQTLTVLENFESGVGLFNTSPTFSGSTAGISTLSTSAQTTETSYQGNASLKVILKDNTSSSSNWSVRLVSGSGVPANNTLLSSDGYIGYWLKTSSAPSGAEVSINIREGGVSGAPLEMGVKQSVINDGNWHLYQWNLDNNNDWDPFTGNGNIDDSNFTLDAILLYAPNDSPDWTLYIDYVTKDFINPLPVEIISFASSFEKNKVHVRWSTASELNNYGFEVERSEKSNVNSEDALWQTIGFVTGSGNSNSIKDYSFTDDVYALSHSGSILKYRLKQIDTDGSFKYSNEVEIDVNGIYGYELSQNYPNPFNPVTTIRYSVKNEGLVNFEIYNLLGELIASPVNEIKQSGNYELQFDGTSLSSGIYFYKIRAGEYVSIKKMILMK